jgi:glycosyltransferase involved in cell wall biosynthesis
VDACYGVSAGNKAVACLRLRHNAFVPLDVSRDELGDRDRPIVVLIGAPLPPPFGGIARYIQLAVPALARRGFRVRVMQPDQGMEPSPLAGLPADADVRTAVLEYPGAIRLSAWLLRRPVLLARLLLLYARALRTESGFAARQFAVTACTIRSAERLVAGERPAIFHAFDWPWSYGVAAVQLARRAGARSMFSLFGDVLPHREELQQFDSLSKPFLKPARFALRATDVVASMTGHCRNLVLHVGISPSDVLLVRVIGDMAPFHPGVDGRAIRARYLNGDGPLLVFVGQIRPRKGPQILIEAFPAIRERHPKARALFVGPDHDFVAELRRTAARLGIAHAVEFVGAVPDEDLPAYYAAADVFIFPTMTTIECLGLSFVQAMLVGTPVIATSIAGAPEVIRDGQDGFLVEPGDARALAHRVEQVVALPPATLKEVGLRGRERALELFDEEEVLNDLFRAYDRLLEP